VIAATPRVASADASLGRIGQLEIGGHRPSLDVLIESAEALTVTAGEVPGCIGGEQEDKAMRTQRGWWMVAVALLILSPWSVRAQERSVWPSQPHEKLGPLAEVVAAVNIPAEWGVLRNALPLTGDPPSYTLFFEDAGGNIRIVPLYLTLAAGSWQLSVRRDPVVVIRRGP
jgi:hypothetical protein